MPTVETNDITLNYEQEGTGEDVVFINGLTMDLNGWHLQVSDFARRFRLLRYDCRGQGRSDKPSGAYTHSIHARDLLGLLDALGIEKAHLVGLSNGGMIAIRFALEYPERVDRLVLVDTTCRITPLLRLMLEAWIKVCRAGGVPLLFDVALPVLFSDRYVAENREQIALMKKLSIERNEPEAVVRLAEGCMGFDASARVGEISRPTLIVHGEEDILIPPRHAHALHDAIAGSELHIVGGAAHVPIIEKPDEFNDVVIRFLEASGGAAAGDESEAG